MKNVEKRIWDIEGFEVQFTKDGKNVRGDKTGFLQWDGKKQSKNGMTVGAFKDKVKKKYPGYDIKVMNSSGEEAHGATHLGTVRDTYDDEDND